MKLKFDENRAREVFTVLQQLWDRREGVFRGVVLPEDRFQLPADPVKRANRLLFTAITQRGGIVSDDPFKYLDAMEQTYPDLFDPYAIMHHWHGPRDIQRALQEIVIERKWKREAEKAPDEQLMLFADSPAVVNGNGNRGLYKVDEFATSWWRNAITLAKRWDGNILVAFDGVTDFERFFDRVDYKRNEFGLHGMRRKILALFTIWLQKFQLVPTFPAPLPVDFHAMRLLFATSVVRAHGVPPFVPNPEKHPDHLAGRKMLRVTERIMDEIAIWSQKFMSQNGFSHLAINPALWVLSRELCPHEFQNQSAKRKKRMVLNWSDVLTRYPQLWPVPYNDPAPHCPLAHWCTKTIAWGPYYDWGLLTLDRRLKYPHPRLANWQPPSEHVGRRKKLRA